MDINAVSLDCWPESCPSIVQEGVGRPLPLTGASHTPTENCLGGPTDPVQDGTLGGWGSYARSLFCLSCVSHPCLGTVPRAGVQTSPSPAATPLPPHQEAPSTAGPFLPKHYPLQWLLSLCSLLPAPKKKRKFREGNNFIKGTQLQDIRFRPESGLGDSKACAPNPPSSA